MLLSHPHTKESFLPPIEKENNNFQNAAATKRSSFLIKKNQKANNRYLSQNHAPQPSEPLEMIVRSTKLNVLNSNPKENGVVGRKINASKVKRTLVYDKENQNGKFDGPNTNNDLAQAKTKFLLNPKGRSVYKTSDISNKEAILLEKARRTTFNKNVNTLEQRKETCTNQVMIDEDTPQEFPTQEQAINYPTDRNRSLTFINPTRMVLEEEPLPAAFNIESDATVREYATDILGHLKEKNENEKLCDFLRNHKIPPMLRAKMIDWMIEVMCSYKCLDETFFLAVSIMDNFFQRSQTCHSVNDLHLLGVTAMFMATKFEEIYPIRLNIVQEKIAHGKLSLEEIMVKEGEVLQALNFNVTPATTYDFVTNVLFQLNLKTTMNSEVYDYLKRVCVYLAKANTFDYQLANEFTPSQLAASTIFVAFKVIEQLDRSIDSNLLMTKVSEILEADENVVYNCATRILDLAKNFETVYPSFLNLKKYHFIGVADGSSPLIQTQSPEHAGSINY